MPSPRFLPFILTPLILLAACQRKEIRAYNVPKEKGDFWTAIIASATKHLAESREEDAQPGNPHAGGQAPPVAALPREDRPEIAYTAPPGWAEVPSSGMTAANFMIEGGKATVTVTPLTDLGNAAQLVQMWGNAVEAPPVPDDKVDSLFTTLPINGDDCLLFEIAGPGKGKPSRVVVVVQQIGSWYFFYKLVGDDALVTVQKPALVGFVGTIKLKKNAAAAAANPHPITDPSPSPAPAAPATPAPAPKSNPNPITDRSPAPASATPASKAATPPPTPQALPSTNPPPTPVPAPALVPPAATPVPPAPAPATPVPATPATPIPAPAAPVPVPATPVPAPAPAPTPAANPNPITAPLPPPAAAPAPTTVPVLPPPLPGGSPVPPTPASANPAPR